MIIKFEFEKETTGTYRFKEASEEPIVGTLYIQKSALKELDYKRNECIVVSISKED